MPDASPNAFSTHTCHKAQLLNIVTALLLIKLVKSCFDKIHRRKRDVLSHRCSWCRPSCG